MTVMLTFEAGPQVCNEDLCSLVQSNCRVFEAVSVVETGEVVDQKVHQSSSRAVGFFYAIDEAAIESLSMVS